MFPDNREITLDISVVDGCIGHTIGQIIVSPDDNTMTYTTDNDKVAAVLEHIRREGKAYLRQVVVRTKPPVVYERLRAVEPSHDRYADAIEQTLTSMTLRGTTLFDGDVVIHRSPAPYWHTDRDYVPEPIPPMRWQG